MRRRLIILRNQRSKLSLSERATRLLVVFTIFGALWTISIKLSKYLLAFTSETLYINSLFNMEHIIVICFIASGILIGYKFITYCYHELIQLTNKNAIDNKSESHFKDLFTSLNLYFSLSVGLMLISIIILKKQWILMIPLIILLIAFCFVPKIRKPLVRVIKHNLSSIKEYAKQSTTWLVTLLFVAIMFLMIVINITGSASITFYKDQRLEMEFINKIPDQVELTIISKHNSQSIVIKSEDFSRSFIEVTECTSQNNSNSRSIQESLDFALLKQSTKYKYNYVLSFDNYIDEGKNFIVIMFKLNGLIDRQTNYKIVNQIDKKDGQITINRDKFQIDF